MEGLPNTVPQRVTQLVRAYPETATPLAGPQVIPIYIPCVLEKDRDTVSHFTFRQKRKNINANATTKAEPTKVASHAP
jgi:hypothetical protein